MKTSITMADELFDALLDHYGETLKKATKQEVNEIFQHLLQITSKINFLREKYSSSLSPQKKDES